jgi:hypothetical protein
MKKILQINHAKKENDAFFYEEFFNRKTFSWKISITQF